MLLTVEDLEHLQADYPDYRIELVDGKIVVVSPCGYEPDQVAFQVGANLWNWVKPRQLGKQKHCHDNELEAGDCWIGISDHATDHY